MKVSEGHIKVARYACSRNFFAHICGLAEVDVQALNAKSLLEIICKAGCGINPTAQKQPCSLFTYSC